MSSVASAYERKIGTVDHSVILEKFFLGVLFFLQDTEDHNRLIITTNVQTF